MSNRLIEAFKTVQASPTQRLVAYMLADACNEQTGRCDPSVEKLIQLTSLSDRAIETSIKHLEVMGHLTVNRRIGARNTYILHPKTSEPPSLVAGSNQRTSFAPEPPSPPKQVSRTSESPSQTSEPRSLITEETERNRTSTPGSSAPPPPDEPPLNGKKFKPRACRPKKESTADPRHAEFVHAFAEAWASANDGESYPVTPRDGQNLKDFLKKCNKPVPELMRGVEWCWQVLGTDGQHAAGIVKGSTTIAGFVTNYGGLVPYSKAYKAEKQRR